MTITMNELSSGTQQHVFFITEKVAIKILDKTKLDQKTQRLLSREISSMERLHHPNIIRLYEVIETLAKLHIIMEYATGGELFTKISNEGRLTEKEARPLFAQIIAAVEHMVGAGVVMLSCLWILSYLMVSFWILSYPMVSFWILSYPMVSFWILSYMIVSF